MPEVFITLVNMSINAGWLIIAIILLRLIFKRIPKFIVVIMWALVGIRLILPISIESFFSLLPSGETIPQDIISSQSPEIHSGIPAFNSVINPAISDAFAPTSEVSPIEKITEFLAVLWLIGLLIMIIYGFISYALIKRKVRESVQFEKNIFLCDHIPSPFILGIFSPKIYIPSYCEEGDFKFIIAHENAHLKRLDHLWKPLGFLLLSIYWFNPLLWVAYVLLCRDIESACDEKVIKTLGADIKKDYSTVLVNFSHQRRIISACPIAFGETNIKTRVKTILNYKKPVFWVIIVSIILVVALAVGFLTNPKNEIDDRLKVFIDLRIAEHHQGKMPDTNYSSIDYEILDIKENSNEITLYMWVLYQEYSYENGEIKEKSGAHTPTVITAEKIDGNYQLIEYWIPRDGSYYADDIKAKFPWYLHLKALDSQRYINKQEKACKKLAEEYFKESISNIGGADGPESISVDINKLKQKYPEFFNFESIKGVEVYMWEDNGGKYVCTFLPGRNSNYTIDTLRTVRAIPLEEGRIIASTYVRSETSVIAIKNPHTTDTIERCEGKKYIEMKHIFFPELTKSYFQTSSQMIKTDTIDIDRDGKEEMCTVSPGTTSGNFTFKINVYENGKLEYSNTFLAEPFSEFYFDQSEKSYFVVRKSDESIICYEISFEDGNIKLINNGKMVAYWGEQGIKESEKADFELIVKDSTVSWEYNPMLSYTGHYIFYLNFDCGQDDATVYCDEGTLITLIDGISAEQKRDKYFDLGDKNAIGWSPDATIDQSPENVLIYFHLYKDKHVVYEGTIHIYAYKKTDLTVTYQAYLTSDDPLFFSKDGSGMKITAAYKK